MPTYPFYLLQIVAAPAIAAPADHATHAPVLPGGVDGGAVLTLFLGLIGCAILATLFLVCFNQWRQAFGRSSGPWLSAIDYDKDKTELARWRAETDRRQASMEVTLERIDRDLARFGNDLATTLQAVRTDLQTGFTQGFEGRRDLSKRITELATDVAFLKGTLTSTRPPHDNS